MRQRSFATSFLLLLRRTISIAGMRMVENPGEKNRLVLGRRTIPWAVEMAGPNDRRIRVLPKKFRPSTW